MEKLTKAPLTIASLRVSFAHNLHVAEKRASYYEQIKDNFPNILMPEIKSLVADLSDCNFQNASGASQISIATSYFNYVTSEYGTVESFWKIFVDHFLKFSRLFSLSEAIGMNIEFRNTIRQDAKIGTNFSDYFTLETKSNTQISRSLIAVDGSVVYSVADGFLELNIRPIQNQQTNLYDSNQFNIIFVRNTKFPLEGELTSLEKNFREAHRHIEDVFKGCLTEKYWKTIA